MIVVVLFLGIPMTDGEKMIATSATISNNPRNLPRLIESIETLALPGSRALLETLSSLRYTMTRETRPSTMTPPTMPSPDWRLRVNRTRIRMNQANFDRNPTALLKLRIIACRGFSGSKLAEGFRPPSSSRPPNVLFFHKRTTGFLRNTMTATNPDNIATMGISTSPFGLPIPEKMFGRPPRAWGATPNAPAVPETGGREPILGAVKGGAGGRLWNGPL